MANRGQWRNNLNPKNSNVKKSKKKKNNTQNKHKIDDSVRQDMNNRKKAVAKSVKDNIVVKRNDNTKSATTIKNRPASRSGSIAPLNNSNTSKSAVTPRHKATSGALNYARKADNPIKSTAKQLGLNDENAFKVGYTKDTTKVVDAQHFGTTNTSKTGITKADQRKAEKQYTDEFFNGDGWKNYKAEMKESNQKASKDIYKEWYRENYGKDPSKKEVNEWFNSEEGKAFRRENYYAAKRGWYRDENGKKVYIKDKNGKKVGSAKENIKKALKDQAKQDNPLEVENGRMSSGDMYLYQNLLRSGMNGKKIAETLKKSTGLDTYYDKDGNIVRGVTMNDKGNLVYKDKNGKTHLARNKDGTKATSSVGGNILDAVTKQTVYGYTEGQRAATGFMEGANYLPISLSRMSGAELSQADKNVIQKGKESTEYAIGQTVGMMAAMLASGVGGIEEAISQRLIRNMSKKALLKQGIKATDADIINALTKLKNGEIASNAITDAVGNLSKGKKFLAHGAGGVGSSAYIDIVDALKSATDEDGNFNPKAFGTYAALNSGLGALMSVGTKAVGNAVAGARGSTLADLGKTADLYSNIDKSLPVELQSKAVKTTAKLNKTLSAENIYSPSYNTAKKYKPDADSTIEKNIKEYVDGDDLSLNSESLKLTAKHLREKQLNGTISRKEQRLLNRLNENSTTTTLAKNEVKEYYKLIEKEKAGNLTEPEAKSLADLKSKVDVTVRNKQTKKAIEAINGRFKNLGDKINVSVKAGITRDLDNVIKANGGDPELAGKYGGFVVRNEDGTVKELHINADHPNAVNYTVGHELAHVFEVADDYKSFADTVKKYVGEDAWNEEVALCEKEYAGVKGADPEREAFGNFLGDIISADEKFLNKLARTDKTVFEKIYDFIKKLVGKEGDSPDELVQIKNRCEKIISDIGEGNFKGASFATNKLDFLNLGTHSATANLKGLQKGIKLLEEGKITREQLRRDWDGLGGWFQGKDGRWRYEINDRGMKFAIKLKPPRKKVLDNIDAIEEEYLKLDEERRKTKKGVFSKTKENHYQTLRSQYLNAWLYGKTANSEVPLSAVVEDWDALFEAYPSAKQLRIVISDDLGDDSGVFMPSMGGGQGGIMLNAKAFTNPPSESIKKSAIKDYKEFEPKREDFKTEEEYKKAYEKFEKFALKEFQKDGIIHEVQHYIQHLEGFAVGGDDRPFLDVIDAIPADDGLADDLDALGLEAYLAKGIHESEKYSEYIQTRRIADNGKDQRRMDKYIAEQFKAEEDLRDYAEELGSFIDIQEDFVQKVRFKNKVSESDISKIQGQERKKAISDGKDKYVDDNYKMLLKDKLFSRCVLSSDEAKKWNELVPKFNEDPASLTPEEKELFDKLRTKRKFKKRVNGWLEREWWNLTHSVERPYKGYRSIAGEDEAFAVEERRRMTLGQRKKENPVNFNEDDTSFFVGTRGANKGDEILKNYDKETYEKFKETESGEEFIAKNGTRNALEKEYPHRLSRNGKTMYPEERGMKIPNLADDHQAWLNRGAVNAFDEDTVGKAKRNIEELITDESPSTNKRVVDEVADEGEATNPKDSTKDSIENKSPEREEIEKKIENAEKTIEKQDKRIADIEKSISKTTDPDEIATLKKQLAEAKRGRATAKGNRTRLTNKLSKLDETSGSKNANPQNVKNETVKTDATETKQAKPENISQKEKTTDSATELTKRLDDLDSEIKEKEARIRELDNVSEEGKSEEELLKLDQEYAFLEENVKSLKSERSKLKKTLSKAKSKAEPPKSEKPPKKQKTKLPKGEKPPKKPKTKAEAIKEETMSNEQRLENANKGYITSHEIGQHAERLGKEWSSEYEITDKAFKDAVQNGEFGKLKRQVGYDDALEKALREVEDDFGKVYDRVMGRGDYDVETTTTAAEKHAVFLEAIKRAGEGDENAALMHLKLIDKMNRNASLSGHMLQLQSYILKNSPDGRLRATTNEIAKLNEQYEKQLKGKKVELTPEQVQRIISAKDPLDVAKTMDDISKEIWKQIPSTPLEALNQIRHFNMLFNPKTHGRNLGGNTIFYGARMMAEKIEVELSKKMQGRIVKLSGLSKYEQQLAEVKKKLSAEGLTPKEKQKLRSEQSILNGKIRQAKYEINNPMAHSVTRDELKDCKKTLDKRFEVDYANDSKSSTRWADSKRSAGYLNEQTKSKTWNFVANKVNKGIDTNYEFLDLEDRFFFRRAYRKEYIRYCKSKGFVEDINGKKVVTNNSLEKMTEKQRQSATTWAMQNAKVATFRDDSALSDFLIKMKNKTETKAGSGKAGSAVYGALNIGMESVLPFVKTPVNVMRRGVDFSPVGLARGVIESVKAQNVSEFMQGLHHISTGLTGTGVFGLGMWAASHDWITVEAGDVSGDAFYDRDMGYQDYSLVVLGKKYSMSLDWAAPMQFALFQGAAFYNEVVEGGVHSLSEVLSAIEKTASATVTPLMEMSFMSSAKDTVESFVERAYRNSSDGTGKESKEATVLDAAARTLLGTLPTGWLSGFAPQLMNQTAGALDDKVRDTSSTQENEILKVWETFGRQMQNRVPIFRQSLNAKINRKGEEVSNEGVNVLTKLANAFINPSTVKKITMDKYDKAIIDTYSEMSDENGDKTKMMLNLTGNPFYDIEGKWLGKGEKDTRMTYDQRSEYLKTNRGEQWKGIQRMVDSESFKYLTADMKAEEIKDYHYISTTKADAKVFGYKYAKNKLTDSQIDSYGHNKNTWRIIKMNGGSAKDFVDSYVAIEDLNARAHSSSSDYHTTALALEAMKFKGGKEVSDKKKSMLSMAYDVFGDKLEPAKKFLKQVGDAEKALNEYSVSRSAGVAVCKEAGVTDSKKNLSLGLANSKIKTRERTYKAMGYDWQSAQAGGGLKKYGYTYKTLEKMLNDAKVQFDGDHNNKLTKAELTEYIDSLGIESSDEMACVFEHLKSAPNTKNPYGIIKDHLEWGSEPDASTGGGGYGHGHGRRYGHGHGGSGKSSGGTPPATASGAIGNLSVTNPFGKVTNGSKKSNLDDAYRKKAKKLREKSRG